MIIHLKKFLLPLCKLNKLGKVQKQFIRCNSSESSPGILEQLKNKSILRVKGNEASSFLQGLITNDMKNFEEGAANLYALFLNVKGRVMMESVASTSTDEAHIIGHNQGLTSAVQDPKEIVNEIFTCSCCSLEERFNFKGIKAPFARQLSYLEECYIMKDPFSLPNKGEVLVLGADCNFCKKPVCLECSIYFGKRFCLKCALCNIQNLPSQLHSKVKNLIKERDS